MQAVRWLFVLTALTLCTRAATAQARPQGATRAMRDTLPEVVAQRMLDAYKRGDIDATYANFDSVYMHEKLGDPAGAQRVRRSDTLRHDKADTGLMPFLKRKPFVSVRSDVSGPYVSQVWTLRSPNGTEYKHFELLEVRGGKIVREIEN